MTELTALTQPTPPWLRITTDDGEAGAVRLAQDVVLDAGGAVITMSGRRMRSEPDLLTDFAQQWDFPDYFGRNPAALEDCLTDLGWLPTAPVRLLVIRDAQEMLSGESPAVLSSYLALFDRVCAHWAEPIHEGEWWDRPAVPFHVLFVAATACAASGLSRRWMISDVEIALF